MLQFVELYPNSWKHFPIEWTLQRATLLKPPSPAKDLSTLPSCSPGCFAFSYRAIRDANLAPLQNHKNPFQFKEGRLISVLIDRPLLSQESDEGDTLILQFEAEDLPKIAQSWQSKARFKLLRSSR